MKYMVSAQSVVHVEAVSPADAVVKARDLLKADPEKTLFSATQVETVDEAAKRGFKELMEGTPTRGSGK